MGARSLSRVSVGTGLPGGGAACAWARVAPASSAMATRATVGRFMFPPCVWRPRDLLLRLVDPEGHGGGHADGDLFADFALGEVDVVADGDSAGLSIGELERRRVVAEVDGGDGG